MSNPEESAIVTLNVTSGADNGPMQYISADRLKHLEDIEKSAKELVRLRRSFELGYRDLEDTIFKGKL